MPPVIQNVIPNVIPTVIPLLPEHPLSVDDQRSLRCLVALMIPAKNGNTCPGGTSYAGAGYCKVRGDVQYFPAKNGITCPGGSSYAGSGYCKVR